MSVSSVVIPKRAESAVMEQIKSSALNFVPAQHPEAISTRPASYIHIKPSKNDSDKGSDDSDDEENDSEGDVNMFENGKQNLPSNADDSDFDNESEFEDALVLDPKKLNKKKQKTLKKKELDTKDRKNLEIAQSFFSKNSTLDDLAEDDDNSENDKDFALEDDDSDVESSSESEEEEDDDGSDYGDEESAAEDDTDDHKGGKLRLSKIDRKEILDLKKGAELHNSKNQDTNNSETHEKATRKKASETSQKSLQAVRSEVHNNDASYLTQQEKIINRTKQELSYIQDKNLRYDFTDPGSDPKDKGSHPETSRIHKVYPKGIVNSRGLINTGVTCYMNSALQALFHVPAMACYLKEINNGIYKNTISAKSVSRDLAHLHQRLTDPNAKKKNITPYGLIKRLDDINPLMSQWEQEDSHEYFMSLLSRLQEDSVPKGQKMNSSIIHEMFGGTFLQTVVCQECNHESETHQDFFDIQVSIDKTELTYTKRATLRGSIRQYFEPSVIRKSKTEGYDCEKCKKKTSATTSVKIEHAPEYLIVSVKRYEYTNNAIRGSSQKIKQHLVIAPQIELSQFAADTNEPVRYQLLSFVSHEGRSASSGHYVAHCQQNNESWAMYDDEFVHTIGNAAKVLKSKLDVYFMVYTRLRATPKPKAEVERLLKERVGEPEPEPTPLQSSSSSPSGGQESSQESESSQDEVFTSAQSSPTREKEPAQVSKKERVPLSRGSGPLSLTFKPKNTLKKKASTSSLNENHSSHSESSQDTSSFAKLAEKMRSKKEKKAHKRSASYLKDAGDIDSNDISLHDDETAPTDSSSATVFSKKNSRKGTPMRYGSQKKRKVDSEIDKIFGRARK